MTASAAVLRSTQPRTGMTEAKDAGELLNTMLADAGIAPQHIYQPGDVQRILCISSSSFRRFCELWEPGSFCPKFGLENIRLNTHRRVTHQALVD